MRKPYHSANLATNAYPNWKVITLSWVAYALGLQFKIEGVPYGAEYHTDFHGENIGDGLNDAF